MKLVKNKRTSFAVRLVIWGFALWFLAEAYLPGMPRVVMPTFYPLVAHVTFKGEWANYQERSEGFALPAMFSNTTTPEDAMNRLHSLLGYGSDEEIFGQPEHYATPTEVALAGRGDCDDFATVWYHMLKQQGYEHVGVAVGYLENNIDLGHAVTLVKVGGTTYVLDVNEVAPVELATWAQNWRARLIRVGDDTGTHSFNHWVTH